MKIAVILLAVLATAYGRSSRIVNGDNVNHGEYKHQVSLQYSTKGWFGRISWHHTCGGSVIGKHTVLTAAHCLDSSKNYRIVAGHHGNGPSDGTAYTVAGFELHPGYNGGDSNEGTFDSDIAVIFVNEEFPDDHIIPLAANSDGNFIGETATISGWGTTESGSLANHLQHTTGEILSKAECQREWDTVSGANIYDGHICIHDPHTGSCSGDSGGPMKVQRNGKFLLIGVTSWGISSCSSNTQFPSVYARVSYFADWVNGYKDL